MGSARTVPRAPPPRSCPWPPCHPPYATRACTHAPVASAVDAELGIQVVVVCDGGVQRALHLDVTPLAIVRQGQANIERAPYLRAARPSDLVGRGVAWRQIERGCCKEQERCQRAANAPSSYPTSHAHTRAHAHAHTHTRMNMCAACTHQHHLGGPRGIAFAAGLLQRGLKPLAARQGEFRAVHLKEVAARAGPAGAEAWGWYAGFANASCI